MAYIISGLDGNVFAHLFGKDEHYLAAHRAVRVRAETASRYPDRIALRDVPEGENAILINHVYQSAESPYFGTHAIYIHEGAITPGLYVDQIPDYLATRLLSLRAFNDQHRIMTADVTPGHEAERLILQLLDRPDTRYIHAHSARFGCYLCLIERS
jgi:hypothetical protein